MSAEKKHQLAPVVINRDGTLNIHRPREKGKLFNDLYHYFLSISWPKFIWLLIAFFFLSNLLFGVLYFAAGPDALAGCNTTDDFKRFWDCFFFSVQLLNGPYVPKGYWMYTLVTLETYLGILTLVLITGIFYARFARPQARVLFSNNALIGQYNGKPCFMFRVANERLNQIIEARMTLTLTKNEVSKEGEASRRFYDMNLERDYSPLFALSWTLRHFIDETSPLHGMDLQQIKDTQVVIFASLTGIDETFSQTITSRSVYRWDEIVFGKRFKDMLQWKDNKMHINLKGIHDVI